MAARCRAHQFTEDGEMVVSGPAGEGDAAEEASPLDTGGAALPRHHVHPGGVVCRVALAVGQEQPLAEGALERARHPRVPEHDAVLPPQARVDLGVFRFRGLSNNCESDSTNFE